MFNGTVNPSTSIPHGITGIGATVSIDGYVTSQGATVPYSFYISATNFVSTFVDSANILVNAGTSRTGVGTVVMTLTYTKS